MPPRALSQDTDRRFVAVVLARGLADARLVAHVAAEHEREAPARDARRSLAQKLCDRGVLDRRVATTVLKAVRAELAGAPRIGHYTITGELGRGGMGVVYRAYDTKIRRPVAIKMILDAGLADAEDLERFEREARAAAKVSHPGIVQVFEAGVSDKKPYIVMELVEGRSLEALLKGGDAITPRRIAEIVLGVAEALQHAHERGVIHRDVKPQNVLVDALGRPHLADFGLARDANATRSLTVSGSVLGTPAYLAPEQARGETRAQGPLTDVYALGAILYRALVGRPPFEASNVNALLMKVCLEEPVPPRRIRSQVSADLETIALRCLEKEPARRYSSAGAVAADLRRFLDGEAILARPIGPVERLGRAARRRWHLLAPLALVVVGVAVAAPLFAHRMRVREAESAAEARRQAEARLLERTLGDLERDLDLAEEINILIQERSSPESTAIAILAASRCADLDPDTSGSSAPRVRAIRDRACAVVASAAVFELNRDDCVLADRALAVEARFRPGDGRIAERRARIAPYARPEIQLAFRTAMVDAFGATERGDEARVRACLRDAASVNSRAASPWVALARRDLRSGDLAAALANAEHAIELNPESPAAYMARGRVQASRGDFDAALADFERVRALAPGSIDVLRSIAGAQVGRSRGREALAALDELEQSPRAARYLRSQTPAERQEAAHYRGVAYQLIGDPAEAEKWLSRAIEIAPDPQAHFWRARVRFERRDREGAIRDLEAYIAHPSPLAPQLLPLARAMLEDLKRRSR